jgi:hypothetical protein
MYARVISFSGADPAKRENAVTTIIGTVLPMLREQDGYAGYIALWDPDSGSAKAVILWDSEETARASDEALAERRVELTRGLGLTIESIDLYEAPVVELETANV